MARFTLPRDIYFGKGAIEELANLKGFTKAVIVTGGSSMKKTGYLQKCENALTKAGMEVKIFEGVEPDPSVETVYRGAEFMREFGPDLIVSIGGGSPMDAAKAMWVFYEYPELKFDDIKDPFSMPQLRKKAKFAAIPSTSGTASEVTAFSVITDYSNKVKYPLADFEITPDIAILDSDIPLSMPKNLTADTGMDALTHAIEAYVASLRSPFSDPLAIKAIQMIVEYLEDSYNGDADARGQMHIAQCLAGMSFSNALLGITHSLAHKIGAQFEIPHGRCNAMLLPNVIRFNAKAAEKGYADIARAIGLPGATDKILVNSLVEMIEKMNSDMGIPASFKEAGVSEELFNTNIDFISQQAALDPCTGANPRTATPEDLKKILTCTFHGEKVNF